MALAGGLPCPRWRVGVALRRTAALLFGAVFYCSDCVHAVAAADLLGQIRGGADSAWAHGSGNAAQGQVRLGPWKPEHIAQNIWHRFAVC